MPLCMQVDQLRTIFYLRLLPHTRSICSTLIITRPIIHNPSHAHTFQHLVRVVDHHHCTSCTTPKVIAAIPSPISQPTTEEDSWLPQDWTSPHRQKKKKLFLNVHPAPNPATQTLAVLLLVLFTLTATVSIMLPVPGHCHRLA